MSRHPHKPQPQQGPRIKAALDDSNPNRQTPSFNLQYLHADYSLRSCTREEKAAFADTLAKLGQMTWQQIMQSPRHGRGFEFLNVTTLKGAHIPPNVTEEVRLMAFRFHTKKPMVGYRGKDGVTFYILFLDRDFTLYSHG